MGSPAQLYQNSNSDDYRVLSIQSHVVSGYVGNRSAVFPLQVLGFDVDFINTVQFSNHTGYPVVKGSVLDELSLQELYDGLKENDLDRQYSHLLTGFVRSKGLLCKLGDIARDLKRTNPSLVYVCDPVLGDHGKMYVNADVLEVYRDTILSLADIMTPNQFEAELLSDIRITDAQSAVKAMDCLHDKGPRTIIISSSELGNEEVLVAFASSMTDGKTVRYRIDIPRFPASFNGTGDLFAAVFLAWHTKSDGNLQHSLEATVSTLQAVIRRTLANLSKINHQGILSPKDLELRLVQSRSDIEHPVICVNAVELLTPAASVKE
ncbi:pyridoxal kinase-like isoform X1 [Paramacrobiotus metropolitanus]|uniref:pyridoxal kinase-like isoform X1 n=1 Tax=Paramacrobiotus metropolitanus TaxID=2943436 RepID=UPI002445A1D8|nr:pyridoxal kinase-like isoform X1 [Paramacrobiotus metropolitanus]